MRKNIAVILLSVIFLNLIYMAAEFLVPLPAISKTAEIQIPKGATFRQAVEILAKEGLIRDKNLFLFMGRLTGLHRKIRAGYYSITGAKSPFDILVLLKSGQIIEYAITVVEGDSLIEIGEKLINNNIVDSETFRKLTRDRGFLKTYNIDAPSVEGYLFPETYNLPKGIAPEDALVMMISMMREKFSGNLKERAAEIGFTENEVLTLASIIEKEAMIDEERPLISAVYHNRLRRKMPLQADPTAIYGIKSSREKITSKDLKRKTHYNTYVIRGLPPGPIASPGKKSIKAALYPEDVPYIYFVSNNDGSHQFSVTAEEHLKAVQTYRLMRQIEKEIQKQKEKEMKMEKQKEMEKGNGNNKKNNYNGANGNARP